ncbi:hypothetical protein BGZ63DRAFT_128817 [Mariannaea sp. PMI_226]|nr:hypothetical protein BGZ63DRAFT_128817 [Mariannaea sp. PMI_226]
MSAVTCCRWRASCGNMDQGGGCLASNNVCDCNLGEAASQGYKRTQQSPMCIRNLLLANGLHGGSTSPRPLFHGRMVHSSSVYRTSLRHAGPMSLPTAGGPHVHNDVSRCDLSFRSLPLACHWLHNRPPRGKIGLSSRTHLGQIFPSLRDSHALGPSPELSAEWLACFTLLVHHEDRAVGYNVRQAPFQP